MRCALTKWTILPAAMVVLSGCAQIHLSSDFGAATRQNLAAQISDPDARYVGSPAPGSAGTRVSLAQQRYNLGMVIAPVGGTASTVGASGAPASAPPPAASAGASASASQ